jgi:hypothetical protein
MENIGHNLKEMLQYRNISDIGQNRHNREVRKAVIAKIGISASGC